MADNPKIMALVGDIGGTKTTLAVISSESGPYLPLLETTFQSRDYPDFLSLAGEYLSLKKIQVRHAVFGVAGPVVGGKSSITNLPWVLDEAKIGETLGLCSVRLINDLQALAEAVPFLRENDLYTLNKGCRATNGTIAVIAPGTGLGEAYLTWSGKNYRAHPSEGGHADFSPTNEFEICLFQYLFSRFNHVSFERVCSGKGIANIYGYLKEHGPSDEPRCPALLFDPGKDPTPAIIQSALDPEKPCRICRIALDAFISILGTEAGNMALKVMASGGVYLGGGILPRILPSLETGLFMNAFLRKGRMSGLMSEIPVHVILNPRATLLGAALHIMPIKDGPSTKKF
jgi:glucokinase